MQRIVKTIIESREKGTELDRAKLADIVERGIASATYCENKASRVEDAIEDIVAFECLQRIPAKEYTGLVAAVTDDGAVLLLDNGCVAYAPLGGGDDDVAYSYGSEAKVRFDRVDFEEGKLYVSF